MSIEIANQLLSDTCLVDGVNIIDVITDKFKATQEAHYNKLSKKNKEKIHGEYKSSKIVLETLLSEEFNHNESIKNYNRDNKTNLEKNILNIVKDSNINYEDIENNLIKNFTIYLNNDINDDDTPGNMREEFVRILYYYLIKNINKKKGEKVDKFVEQYLTKDQCNECKKLYTKLKQKARKLCETRCHLDMDTPMSEQSQKKSSNLRRRKKQQLGGGFTDILLKLWSYITYIPKKIVLLFYNNIKIIGSELKEIMKETCNEFYNVFIRGISKDEALKILGLSVYYGLFGLTISTQTLYPIIFTLIEKYRKNKSGVIEKEYLTNSEKRFLGFIQKIPDYFDSNMKIEDFYTRYYWARISVYMAKCSFSFSLLAYMLEMQTYSIGLINTILGTFGRSNISSFTLNILKTVVIGPFAEELAKVFSLKFGFGNVFMLYFNYTEFTQYVKKYSSSPGIIFRRFLSVINHYLYYISHKIADKGGKMLSYGAIFSHMFNNFLTLSPTYIEWESTDGTIKRFLGNEEKLFYSYNECNTRAMTDRSTDSLLSDFYCSDLGMTLGEVEKLRFSLPTVYKADSVVFDTDSISTKYIPTIETFNSLKVYLKDIFSNLFGCLNISKDLLENISLIVSHKTITTPSSILTLPAKETKKQRGGKKSKLRKKSRKIKRKSRKRKK